MKFSWHGSVVPTYLQLGRYPHMEIFIEQTHIALADIESPVTLRNCKTCLGHQLLNIVSTKNRDTSICDMKY